MAAVSDKRGERYAWIGWAALFLATAAIIVHDSSRSVVPAYRISALQWIAGQPLYELSGIGGFTYFPQAAILFVPFALLPPALGEVLWRLVNIGVLAFGLRSFARLAGERSEQNLFTLMTLVTIPIAWDCARNGQATLAMTGLMLLAVTDVAGSRWWRAALWLSLAVAIKPLAIVLVLLIIAIDRPMTWRVLLGMLVLALAPFVTQHAAYVLQQYAACMQNMTISAHVGVAAHGWTSPFTALRSVAGINVPESVQTVVRLAAAFATLGLCFFSRMRHDAARSAVYVFTLAALYLILFSPRTENNTYAMLGPAIAVFLASGFQIEKRTGEGILLTLAVLALLGSRVIERTLAPHAEQIWLSPLLAAGFAVYLLVRLFTDRAEANERTPARRQV